MRWTLEMEEEFIDLEIMERILDDKRNVKGNFIDGIYIKEERTEFAKVSSLNGEISIYLPEDREEKEHYGRKFAYPEKMGTYEEYVVLNERICFTIEKASETVSKSESEENKLPDMENWKELTIDSIEDNNDDTVVTQIEDLSINGIQIYSLMIKGFIGEEPEQYAGYIYLIIYGTQVYRIYAMSEYGIWELTYKLGKKIAENIEIKAG